MITSHEVFLSVVVSYLSALVIVYVLKKTAWSLGFVDRPNERSCHKEPTPRGGGLGICLVTLVGGAIALTVGPKPTDSDMTVAPFYLGAVILAIVGLLDDKNSLPRWTRLCVHLMVAVVTVLAYGCVKSISMPIWGEVFLPRVGFIVTILWIVGLINAFNFMDGIDGIAAGQAAVSGLGWLIIAAVLQEPWIAFLAALLVGSSLGFLFYNWSPASIFMGDVGSTFLGYTFASMPLMMSSKAAPATSTMLIVGALLVWPIIFDSLFTFFRRLLNGQNVFKSHRSHIYQHFVLQGYGAATVASAYMCLDFTGIVMAVFWLTGPAWSGISIITALIGLCVSLTTYWLKTRDESDESRADAPICSPKV